ncbi:unnamed protein product, partial [Amoebophrya sp. A25]
LRIIDIFGRGCSPEEMDHTKRRFLGFHMEDYTHPVDPEEQKALAKMFDADALFEQVREELIEELEYLFATGMWIREDEDDSWTLPSESAIKFVRLSPTAQRLVDLRVAEAKQDPILDMTSQERKDEVFGRKLADHKAFWSGLKHGVETSQEPPLTEKQLDDIVKVEDEQLEQLLENSSDNDTGSEGQDDGLSDMPESIFTCFDTD